MKTSKKTIPKETLPHRCQERLALPFSQIIRGIVPTSSSALDLQQPGPEKKS